MGFPEAIRKGLNNFFSTNGRAGRSEFWWYWLFVLIISGVLGVIGGFTSGYGGMEQTWVGIIFDVLAFILSLSVLFCGVRRLHDVGKSGWNILWILLPLVGPIYLIVLYCQPSQPWENQWGPVPSQYYN